MFIIPDTEKIESMLLDTNVNELFGVSFPFKINTSALMISLTYLYIKMPIMVIIKKHINWLIFIFLNNIIKQITPTHIAQIPRQRPCTAGMNETIAPSKKLYMMLVLSSNLINKYTVTAVKNIANISGETTYIWYMYDGYRQIIKHKEYLILADKLSSNLSVILMRKTYIPISKIILKINIPLEIIWYESNILNRIDINIPYP